MSKDLNEHFNAGVSSGRVYQVPARNFFGKPIKIPVGPQIDDNTVSAFTGGSCHGLAYHIWLQTGGTHTIGAVRADFTNHKNYVTHLFNYDPKNTKMGYDVKGYRPVREIVKDFGDTHTPMTHAEFEQEMGTEGWLPVHHSASRRLAKMVLKLKGSNGTK